MFWNERMETLRGADLEALQLKRLKWSLSQAMKVPFYRSRFRDAGIRPSDVKSLDDMGKLPFTCKKELREGYPFGFLAVPREKVIRIHTTSGTTGKPTVVGYTKRDLARWAGLIARNMTMVGLRKGDVFQNAVNYGLFTGGLGFHSGAELMGLTVVPAGIGNTKRQIEMINDFGVSAIHCTPSYAMHIAEVAEEMGATVPTLKFGLFGAEPWSESMRAELERRLDLSAFDSYGLSEMYGPGVAFECPEKDGLHIWHDSFLVEIIDPKTGEDLEAGERGEMVITPLVKEAMPLVRYRTGDMTMLREDGCSCGRGQKISRIMGRADDMLVIRGINVFPSQIEHVLLGLPEVGDHFMVYVDKVNYMDELTIEVEMTRETFSGELSDLARIQKRVTSALRDVLGIRTSVRLVEPGTLPRFEGKAKRIVDRRGGLF
ncbi:MAG: phenylacetate--CoA ligase [Methanomicrobiales archaeon]|nr:phenylacetate--CoA ligase [Methanomicrobiales archaeon]